VSHWSVLRILPLLAALLLPLPLWAQVVVGPGGGGGVITFPVTACVNQVAIALSAQGVLTCSPVLPAMTTGLAPTGVDLSALGQVLSTHLTVPLPLTQGGVGLSSGNTGGVLYFSSSATVASTPTLPQHAPLFGGGAGDGPQVGTRSGTTLEVATVLGPHNVGKQLAFDVDGNIVASPHDVGAAGGGPSGAVSSVFGRIGNVVAQGGDYTAAQVTNAADRSAANVFTHASGQSMYQLQLLGSISGSLILRTAQTAGSSLLILPQGVTDFTVTGGPGQVVRQSALGGPFGVGQLALSEILGTANLCSTAVLCPGYQAALGFLPEDLSNKSTNAALGTSTTLYPTQGAVKAYVDTGLAGKQATLGFVPEDSANKAASVSLGLSNTAYPTQAAVKSYVDTGLAAKQNTLAFTPEDVANKATSPSLGTSNTAYPSQGAVKSYVDTGLAGKQASVTWGAGLGFAGGIATVLSTENGFLTNGGATALSCGVGPGGAMQVQTNGELQYCDGAAIPLPHSGVLTQAGLRWNVTTGSCTGDANIGKLTINASGEVICAADIGGGGGGGGDVASVFGRTGAVIAQPGDYAAAQVTNAADRTAANIFTHASGQTMARLMLTGTTSGTLSLRPPVVAGTSILTFPAGTTDFTTTGGASQVVRQSGLGSPLTVGQLGLSEISGTGTLCHTSPVCAGYQAALGFTPEDSANKATSPSLGTSNTAYPTQGAVKAYVDNGLALKQNTLGFTPEDSVNKSTAPGLGTSNTLYPTQGAVKSYVDSGLAGKQNSLGFTPENVANKAVSTLLGTSDGLYPSQNAVKVYVDTGLATKQALLAFTPENVANKATGTALGTSDVAYPSQNAVKVYVDTGLATKQATLGFSPENVANKAASTVLGTSDVAYPSQNAVKVYVDTGLATKQATLGFTAVPDTRTLTLTGTANQVTVSLTAAQNLTANRDWTFSLPQNIDVAALARFGSLGLGIVAPTTAGLLSQTAGANAQTLHTLRRATDTVPVGNFATYQTAAGTSLWNVDIQGILTLGSVPAGRITGLTPSRCVETDVTGQLAVAAGLCGVGGGGTGISGATNHGLVVATGGTTANSLGVAANGQLPIGSAGAHPVLATLTGTANQLTVTNGPGSITLSLPTNPILPGITTANLGNATNLPLATGVSGDLLYTNLTPALGASRLLGRGSASAGDWQEVTLGPNLTMSGTVLSATGGGGGPAGDVTTATSLATSFYTGDTNFGHCTWTEDGVFTEAVCDAAKTTLFTSDIILFASGPMHLVNADNDQCATISNLTGLTTYHDTNACQRPRVSRPFDALAFNVGAGMTVEAVSLNGWPAVPVLDGPDSDAGTFAMAIPVLWRDFAENGPMTLQIACHSAALQTGLTLMVRVGVPVCTGDNGTLPGFVAPTTGQLLTCTFGAQNHDVQMSNIVTLTTTGCAAGERMDIPFASEADMTAGWSTTTSFITGGLLTYETVGNP
jgi:hypothetical protein